MYTLITRTLLGSALLMLTALPYASAAEMAPPAMAQPAAGTSMSMKTVDLYVAMRNLWGEHIFWVRNVVLATHYHDTKAAKDAEEQVVQNAKDISGAIAGFYGKEAGDKMFTLLAGHYAAVKEYMNADFKGDRKGVKKAIDDGTKNLDEIAAFLSSANPNLPKDTLVALLTAHFDHHMTQINEVKARNWSNEAKNWNAMLKQVDVIADALSAALVKQFPA